MMQDSTHRLWKEISQPKQSEQQKKNVLNPEYISKHLNGEKHLKKNIPFLEGSNRMLYETIPMYITYSYSARGP